MNWCRLAPGVNRRGRPAIWCFFDGVQQVGQSGTPACLMSEGRRAVERCSYCEGGTDERGWSVSALHMSFDSVVVALAGEKSTRHWCVLRKLSAGCRATGYLSDASSLPCLQEPCNRIHVLQVLSRDSFRGGERKGRHSCCSCGLHHGASIAAHGCACSSFCCT